jgi:asparagine synthase (glutamine-hydrolysing)
MCGIWGILSLNELSDYNFFDHFNKIKHRGPDRSIYVSNPNYIVGFHRLAIMDISAKGDQPFKFSYDYINDDGEKIQRNIYLVINGEIYNWKTLKNDVSLQEFCSTINYTFSSESDCEVILPMFLKYVIYDKRYSIKESIDTGLSELLCKLDGEFAMAIYDIHKNITTDTVYNNLWLARDRFGIRPLFVSQLGKDTIAFGSELKSLNNLASDNKVGQLEPRKWHYYGGSMYSTELIQHSRPYYSIGTKLYTHFNLSSIYTLCRNILTKSVIDRLDSDREIGCLLSGGLDSSLVSAIASNELKKRGKILRTFSIGIGNSPDVKYAQIVAKHIGSYHTNFDIPQQEWITAITNVIRISETIDVTTIRATTAQYLISKKIAETTNTKVLLIGDGSDEATGGYLYFHKAPNPYEFHSETKRLLEDIHYFDVLRADRGIATNGLEARVPFLSHEFIDFYLQINPALRIPQKHTLNSGETFVYEKYLLRKSFEDTNLLPECVLWRKKEAFSDGVSSESKSWYQIVQENIETIISDEEFNQHKSSLNTNSTETNNLVSYSKEAYYYKKIFNQIYPNQPNPIPYYWMPKWIDNVSDPSARTLDIYNNNSST